MLDTRVQRSDIRQTPVGNTRPLAWTTIVVWPDIRRIDQNRFMERY